jgi:short-subunit dehydrogenase
MEISNKIIVITGAGNGIGREIALLALRRGATVAGLDISEAGLKETAELANGSAERFSPFVCDIADRVKVLAVADKIMGKYKKIDILLNVAGIIQPFVKIADLPFEKIEQVMNINFYGTVNMVKAYLPHLRANPNTALIGNVSSMGGFLPVPAQSVYGASKAAVKLFTEALYAEMRGTNVRVCGIYPGAVATNIAANSGASVKVDKTVKTKQYKMLAPEEAAEIIVRGIEKEKFKILVGKDAKFMDFIYRKSPKFAVNLIAKKMSNLLNN